MLNVTGAGIGCVLVPALPGPAGTLHSDFSQAFDAANKQVASVISAAYNVSLGWVILFFLLVGGLVFTVWTRGMQFRYFGHMIRTVIGSREGAGEEGISSFQAFALGLADRVGTGNIAGVAIALVLGGPGAIFWMWVVAFIGMSTAFLESTLAQVFKVRNPDGTFRGGPAFYMADGLGWKRMAKITAVCLILTKGCAFELVQANTIATTWHDAYAIPTWTTAFILLVVSAPFILTGVKPVARLTEYLAPFMAAAYIVLAAIMLVWNAERIPQVVGWIFTYAFGIHSITGGAAGGIVLAMLQGTRRGLYSNEAGMGTVPNAAATATVNHPAKQGFIQSLGVFADTMVVCTCTAIIIMLSGLYDPTKPVGEPNGATLTMNAMGTLGEWTQPIMIVIITIFSYSTLLGNYAYAEGNVKFLAGLNTRARGLKALILCAMAVGSVVELKAVWAIADWMSAICTILNIIAVLGLMRWALGALRDYRAQQQAGIDPAEISFVATGNPHLPGDLPTRIWSREFWQREYLRRPAREIGSHEEFLEWLVRQH